MVEQTGHDSTKVPFALHRDARTVLLEEERIRNREKYYP
jgi:hypothetical protein